MLKVQQHFTTQAMQQNVCCPLARPVMKHNTFKCQAAK